MNILITGATGLIGRPLVDVLLRQKHTLTILSRSPRDSKPGVRYVVWNPADETGIVPEVDGVDAVINLAGEPIAAKRWTRKQKGKIVTSRANATQIIAHSIQSARKKPSVLINASAVGFYGAHGNESVTEESGAGNDFLADVCKAWEAHALRVLDFGVRVVRLRIGVVLAKEGGALKMMLPPFQLGLGGWLGKGNQWLPWVHLEDVVRLISFCLENSKAEGAVNATASQPVTNKAFSMVLAQVLHRPCFAPVPAFALKLLLGEMSGLLLTGARVLPKKAAELGFTFKFPDLRNALEDLLIRDGSRTNRYSVTV